MDHIKDSELFAQLLSLSRVLSVEFGMECNPSITQKMPSAEAGIQE